MPIRSKLRRCGLIAAAAFVALTLADAAAAQTGRVVLYNPGGAKLGELLVAAFNKQQPRLTVDVINAGVGELFTRIKAEQNRPQGDVFNGASIEIFQSDPGLFEPHKIAEDAAFPRGV